jgi:DNA-binding NarL/FixJ family response regulator
MHTKVLLVDDQASMRLALCAFLRNQPGIEIVGQAEDGSGAVRLAGELKPDVVLMDLCLPDIDGIEAIRRLKVAEAGLGFGIGVVLLSARVDDSTRAKALAAGAAACVPKSRAFDQLAPAILVAAADAQRTSSDGRGKGGAHSPA